MTLQVARLRGGVDEHGAATVPSGGQQTQKVLVVQRVELAAFSHYNRGQRGETELAGACGIPSTAGCPPFL